MLDLNFKPNMNIKVGQKASKSDNLKKKEADTFPERWEVIDEDNFYISSWFVLSDKAI